MERKQLWPAALQQFTTMVRRSESGSTAPVEARPKERERERRLSTQEPVYTAKQIRCGRGPLSRQMAPTSTTPTLSDTLPQRVRGPKSPSDGERERDAPPDAKIVSVSLPFRFSGGDGGASGSASVSEGTIPDPCRNQWGGGEPARHRAAAASLATGKFAGSRSRVGSGRPRKAWEGFKSEGKARSSSPHRDLGGAYSGSRVISTEVRGGSGVAEGSA